LTLARYNRPLYVIAAVVVVIGVLLFCSAAPPSVRWLGAISGVVALWFATASLYAFHAMFDRSPLLSGTWLPGLLTCTPEKWVQVSVCLEETTLPMEKLFPEARGELLDIFSSSVMTEPAVTRARSMSQHQMARKVMPSSLGVEDRWADVTVVMLAAHEVRDIAAREALFGELNRITSQSGRIVVVEHLRNLSALLAFGPGLLHFYPKSEWLRLANLVGMQRLNELSITPFVHVFVLGPSTGAY
jgi:hypothetical protein